MNDNSRRLETLVQEFKESLNEFALSLGADKFALDDLENAVDELHGNIETVLAELL